MKNLITSILLLLAISLQAQTISIDGTPMLVSSDVSFPFWLQSGASINPEPPVASISVLEHFKEYAKEIKERFVGKNYFVVEVACNDGILLKPLTELDVNAIGVDPAKNIVEVAKNRNLTVINDFFVLN